MPGEADKFSGKVKEKVGSATGNDRMEGEGKAQHTSGKVEDAVGTARDKAVGAAQAVKDKLSGDKGKDERER